MASVFIRAACLAPQRHSRSLQLSLAGRVSRPFRAYASRVNPFGGVNGELLYGVHPVTAALQAGRRRCFTLFVQEFTGENRPKTQEQRAEKAALDYVVSLAQQRGVRVRFVDRHQLTLMCNSNKLTVHNGVLLDCAKLPFLGPLDALPELLPREQLESNAAVSSSSSLASPSSSSTTDSGPHSAASGGTAVSSSLSPLAPHSTPSALSATTTAAAAASPPLGSFAFKNGNGDVIPHSHLWLALDELTDVQNFGAILRSSLLFGFQVVICAKNSAPLTPAVSKASSGAAELHPVYQTQNLMRFLRDSRANGWRVLGAAAEASFEPENTYTSLLAPAAGPTVLVIGSEQRGLRRLVEKECSALVSIPLRAGLVDSFNVSVAAALLMQQLRGPVAQLISRKK